MWPQDFRTAIHLCTKDGLSPVEVAPHLRVLRSLACEDESDGSLAALLHCGQHALWVCKLDGGFLCVAADHGAAMSEHPAACSQCVSYITKIGSPILFEISC